MKIYGEAWARGVVTRWQGSDPRVKSMLLSFEAWAWGLKIDNPAQFVTDRLVYVLRRSKVRNDWNYIKANVDRKINWRYIFMEMIIPSSKPDWSKKARELMSYHFDFVDGPKPSAKSPIDAQLSTG